MPAIPPNSFAIPFGLVGVAGTWLAAAEAGLVSRVGGDVLLVLSAAVWLAVLVAYGASALRRGTVRSDLAHPVFAPFLSLVVITPMVLSARGVAPLAPGPGAVLVDVFLALTVLHGAWFTGQLMAGDYALDQLHPGYFLPTVAGGLLAAASAAQVGQHGLGTLVFGYGMVCWVVLGSIILGRLFFRPALPPPLRPTMAIEIAPAAVAGLAWAALGNGFDGVAAGLTGYGALMVLAQLRLVPLYVRAPFGVGTWGFTFAWAAVGTVALHWVTVTRPAGHTGFSWVVLAAVSLLVGGIAARTLVALVRGDLFPRSLPAGPATGGPSTGPSHADAEPAGGAPAHATAAQPAGSRAAET